MTTYTVLSVNISLHRSINYKVVAYVVHWIDSLITLSICLCVCKHMVIEYDYICKLPIHQLSHVAQKHRQLKAYCCETNRK